MDIDGEEGHPWWWIGDHNYPSGGYQPDYNSNPGSNTSNNFHNNYSGPGSGSQNGNSNSGFSGGYGGYSGYSGGNQLIDFINTIAYLLGPKHDPSYYLPTYTGIPTPYPGTATAKSSPAKLAKPVGTGASNVYSGGGNRRGNVSQGVNNISQDGLIFIQNHEGFGQGRLHRNPYNDSRNFATVGYGHLLHYSPYTSEDKQFWESLTENKGLDLLNNDLQTKFIPSINRLVKVPLTQNQFDAIVSFTFNVGLGSLRGHIGGLAGSQFLQQLNQGNYNGNLMMRYHTPSEIIGRRQDEINLFNNGEY